MSKEQAPRVEGRMGKTSSLVRRTVLAAIITVGGASTCSVKDPVWVSCDYSEDCAEELPGTTCTYGICTCPTDGEQFCDGRCRPSAVCIPGGLGAGGGGGAGGSEGQCTTAADCPQPGHPRCGTATCENGVCGMELKPFGPLASQVLGDCKERICDGDGNLIELKEGSDVYNDGSQCIDSRCEGGEPVSMYFSPMTVCSENGGKACFQGECVGCIAAMGVPCAGGLVCDGIFCVQAHCVNNVWDQGAGETDVNCGGPCRPCFDGDGCKISTDCLSGACSGGACQIPTCSDGVRNGGEAGKDCGGPSCPLCPNGQECNAPSDCESNVCWTGICLPPNCNDGIKNGDETDWDCGGSCAPCP